MKKFRYIHKHVREHGELTNKAQSAWGADRYSLEIGEINIVATIEDDGYTQGLLFYHNGKQIAARTTAGEKLKYSNCTEEIYTKVMNQILVFIGASRCC